MKTKDIEVFPVVHEELTPKQFIALVRDSPDLIKSSVIRLPRLGSAGLGSIRVEYDRPVYKSLRKFAKQYK